MIDFAALLRDGMKLKAFPPFKIKQRSTDKFVEYNSDKTRLDRIAENIYDDATCSKIIMWANPEYFIEFDIPDNTIIRVPFPLKDVQEEVVKKISIGRNREDLQ